MKHKFIIGVFGIITNKQNQVLLIHRNDYDLWNLPGGGLETGESPWDGVIREIKEETGFHVEVTKLLGVYSKSNKDEIVFSFECKIISGKRTLNEEAKDIQYFAIKDIPKNTSPNQRKRIQDYFKDKQNIILQIDKGPSSIQLIKEGKL
ncbi:MAG: NUDIX domain-containing protein [Candidatus Magasanikbacteria bacterium]|nr:NUDIX domain-containing protein [Candidatus Magasanikbacteria bacterium]MBT4071341.1 NUDIX domain-containing protein [Candidatus Magasanikbacteria bacterium]